MRYTEPANKKGSPAEAQPWLPKEVAQPSTAWGNEYSSTPPPTTSHFRSYDPLLDLHQDEIIRLCRVYEDEIGEVHPILDIQGIIAYAKHIAPLLAPAGMRCWLAGEARDEKTLQLKLIICCALLVENNNCSVHAKRLFESMEEIVKQRMAQRVLDVVNLPFLCLLAGYHFLSNDRVLAWQITGQAVRLCAESCVHKTTGIARIHDPWTRHYSLNCFWSAFVMEQLWSFETHLPCTLRSDEIDPELPIPNEHPFVRTMIAYTHLGAKGRAASLNGCGSDQEIQPADIDCLDRDALEWYQDVDRKLHSTRQGGQHGMMQTPWYTPQYLSIWMFLSLSQLRIWVYSAVLRSPTSIMRNPERASIVVSIAKETIKHLSRLNNAADSQRRAVVFLNQFLTSSVAVLFLASVHNPALYSVICRDDFYTALNLAGSLSDDSWASKRLWRTVKSLEGGALNLT